MKNACITICLILLTSQISCSSWTYANQANWYSTYSACDDNAQSPINIIRTSLSNDYSTVTDIQGSYSSKSDLSILNDGGHTQKVVTTGGTTTYASKAYTLAQFHFHQPSEHTFDGMRYDMEMHFVHQYGTATDYLVLTLFFNIGPVANSFLTKANYSSASATTDASVAISGSLNVWDILSTAQAAKEYVTYAGSFTTPPCTEGVTFVLFNGEPLQMSKAQWDAFATSSPNSSVNYSAGTGNYRSVQALNSRVVYQKFGVLKFSNIVNFSAFLLASAIMFMNM